VKNWLKILLTVFALIGMAAGWVLYDLHRAFSEPALAGKLLRETLTAAQRQRTFSFYVPNSVTKAPALIFVLHGSYGDGVQMRKVSHFQFDVLADREGLIVVYPDGYKGFWNDCRKSADYASKVENIDDPAFFRAMVAFFVERFHADATRVYALGVSNGGHMVYRLALEMPETFAALAAVAANLPIEANLDCRPSGRPVSIAILNGTHDPINPYNGGLVTLFGNSSRGVVRSSAETAKYWTDLAGAMPPAAAERLPERDGNPDTWIDRQIWRGRDEAEIRLYSLHGSGHVLPSRTRSVMDLVLGGAATDLEAAPELWDFFSAHRPPLRLRQVRLDLRHQLVQELVRRDPYRVVPHAFEKHHLLARGVDLFEILTGKGGRRDVVIRALKEVNGDLEVDA
jgi:polyhydroxybutyrate depolymerase